MSLWFLLLLLFIRFAITRAVATRISSEDERVRERSLLLVGGDGVSLRLLGGVVCLDLVGVVLLDVLGGVGGLGLGTGVVVVGWLTKHLANSAKIKLVIVRVIVDIVVVLWLTIGGVYLAAFSSFRCSALTLASCSSALSVLSLQSSRQTTCSCKVFWS